MEDEGILRQLQVLKRQYFQLVEPSQLRWPHTDVLKAPDVQTWIFTNLFDPAKIQFPPLERYQLRVLKALISKLEKAIDDPEQDEISDDLMSAMSSLLASGLPSEADSAQQKAYVTYSYPHTDGSRTTDDQSVTLLEARSVISSSGTTGLRTWEAALFLGSYFTSESGRGLVKHKKLFELGAGTGMLSILCAKYLDVAGIVATDGDEAVVDAIKTNIFLNGLDSESTTGPPVRTAALKWGYPIEAASFSEDYGMEAPDILFGADVTYDKSVIPRLVSSMSEFFELNPALQVLISATIRNEQTFETFMNACGRYGFRVEPIEFPVVPEESQEGPFFPTSTTIKILSVTKRGV